MSEKNVVVRSLIFKLIERMGYQGIAFFVQIIIARILDPSDFGIITILTVFISVSQVFVQSGLNTALVQRKDTSENDYSSVFWISLIIAVIFYIILFFTAPSIANFYKMPELSKVLRVLALILIPGALNSIQNAKVQHEMKFKQLMYCTMISAVVSGGVGIAMAYMGFEYWAIVGQQITNQVCICLTLMFIIKWHPKFVFELNRVKTFFSFGWKLLISSLLDTFYNNLQGLVIGKKYDSSTLGYYNRGNQFPNILISNINGSIQSVIFPTLSSNQDDKAKMKSIMRRSIITSSYIIFPMCMGLAICARPIVSFVLTDKWLPCVPYLQAYCFVYAFWPIHTSNLQAINAMGRSDVFLKLEIIKKTIGITVLYITVSYFDSPLFIVLGQCFTAITSSFINAFPNKKLLGYSYVEQMKDILPSFTLSLLMGAAITEVTFLKLPVIYVLFIQIFLGIIVYWLFSEIFKLECYLYLKEMMMRFLRSRNRGRNRSHE